jgi:CRISPR/Cas system-associated exonuclease Cas4 (RecB family)
MNCDRLTPAEGKPCKHYIRPEHTNEAGLCTLPDKFVCLEALNKKLPAISYTSLQDWIQCKKRYYLRKIQGIEPIPHTYNDALKAGALWDWHFQGRYFDKIEEYQPSEILQAKVQAVIQAHNKIFGMENLGVLQYETRVPVEGWNIHVKIDRAYEDHIVEMKLSGNPDWYTKLENISMQVGTYMLAYEGWGYARMEVARLPQLRCKDGEEPEAFAKRCYDDIMGRVGYYFLGYNSNHKVWGKIFHKNEFNYEEIRAIYKQVLLEIASSVEKNAWYPNTFSCLNPQPCHYLPIRKSGVVSDKLFRRRKKDDDT